MAQYLKPQAPLMRGEDYVYPPTTADQVILSDGTRLEKNGKVYADTLDGLSLSEIMLMIYPVGSIYMSINAVSPQTLFGGTWEQMKDRFLLGAGGSYSAGATGGSATHKLTVNEMPSHSHNNYYLSGRCQTSYNESYYDILTTSYDSSSTTTAGIVNTGGGAAHNNMPPYLAVYMWKRVS